MKFVVGKFQAASGFLAVLSLCAAASVAVAQEAVRPLVVVPGIIGSKLCSDDGTVLWGNTRSLRNFRRLELDGSEDSESIKPCGLIEQIQIMGPLWTVDAYKGLTESLEGLGYGPNGQPVFEFAYDWRRSNIDTAAQLADFVSETIPDGEFDIVAHSMGGIVTRLYLANHGGAERVRNVAYFGTPFVGSMNTFATMGEGWGVLENIIAGGMPAIRRISLSFPSMLELLPRYDRCCRMTVDGTNYFSIDVFDPEIWRRLGWLPPDLQSGPGFETFAGHLETARELDAYLQTSPPAGVQEFRFAGSAHRTHFQVRMRQGATSPDDWLFAKQKGDGVVPVWSAANDWTLTSLADTLVSFSQHATLFEGASTEEQLQRILLRESPLWTDLVSGSRSDVPIDVVVHGRSVEWMLESVDLTVPQFAFSPGDSISAELTLFFSDVSQVVPGYYLPEASLLTDGIEEALTVTETTSDDEALSGRLQYSIVATAGANEAISTLHVQLTNFRSTEVNVVVMKH